VGGGPAPRLLLGTGLSTDAAAASLAARLPGTEDLDAVYDAFTGWVSDLGLELYDHQDEALMAVVSGQHVILSTPTGSGKSLVATGAHFAALAAGRTSYYTAPIKALVSEKFFALIDLYGAERVGMLTGDAAVNPGAPIICCTAEVLANIALRRGSHADIGTVVMDEFHFYSEPDRGWAWQVPLLELPQAQVLLMSATLGPVDRFVDDLTRRTGREVAVVDDAERPVPLAFTWSTTPLQETLEELVTTRQVPAYVVHFTQAAAVEHATSLRGTSLLDREERARVAEVIKDVRFGAGFGRTLSPLLRAGIGVHHAGMLPRYRRLVEQLAQMGLLKVICGTDTLGVGINVPIRTVLFTALAKYDGTRERILRNREFLQIAGRAGRAGFDTVGYVVVQAPEHVIDNERALAKAGDDPKKRRKVHRKKPPEGTVVWTEQTFDKLVAGSPEPLQSRMRIDNSMLVNVLSREEDAFPVVRRLVEGSHEERRSQLRLARRAVRLTRSLLRSGVVTRLDEPDRFGRRYVLTVDLPADFALNQPLAHFALAALDLLDTDSPDHVLDVVSVVEAVLEGPRQVLQAQLFAARGEAVQQMKAEGIEYEERMELLEEVTWPQPLAELLEPAYETYRETHPWLPDDALQPKSVVREMYELGMTFTDFVGRYGLARSEGLVLRYLTDAYRTLRQTVPEQHRSQEFTDLVAWLGATVRHTDSSLLDEWEALNDPAHVVERHEAPPPPVSLAQQERVLRVMVRNALFRRVELVARDDVAGLVALDEADLDRAPLEDDTWQPPGRQGWDTALEAYYAEHDSVGIGPDARGPDLLAVEEDGRTWRVRQSLDDPEGHHDWVVEAVLDLDATDALGEPALHVLGLRQL
jgi:superfamily II RNA helicase